MHTDHLNRKTIHRIAIEHPKIKFIVGEYLVDKLLNCGVAKKNIFALKMNRWYELGICKVKLQEVSHDVPNCCIKIDINGKKCLYVVDTSNVDNIKAKDYDLYLIECNYKEEEIEHRIEEKTLNGEYIYENRVINTHLSYEKAYRFLIDNMGNNSSYQFIHQHIEKEKNV